MDFFSTQNILVHIPIGAGGYDLSWIEAVGTIAGLLCIWLASLEKISNYAFGLVNFTPACCCSCSFLPLTFTAGMHGRDKAATMRLSCRSAGCRAAKRWAGWRPAW